jgi:hypothetical protein
MFARIRRWLRGSTVSADARSVAAGGNIIDSLIQIGLDEEGVRHLLREDIPRLVQAKGVPEALLSK